VARIPTFAPFFLGTEVFLRLLPSPQQRHVLYLEALAHSDRVIQVTENTLTFLQLSGCFRKSVFEPFQILTILVERNPTVFEDIQLPEVTTLAHRGCDQSYGQVVLLPDE